MRKIIVRITAEELCELCGVPPSALTDVLVQAEDGLPGDINVKFYGPSLPPDFLTPEGEFITHLSLRRMQAIMYQHVENLTTVRCRFCSAAADGDDDLCEACRCELLR